MAAAIAHQVAAERLVAMSQFYKREPLIINRVSCCNDTASPG